MPFRSIRFVAVVSAICLAWTLPTHAQRIDPSRGADQQVNYRALTNHGPWDDRNYGLTKADLAFLPPGDADDPTRIPAFYRIMLRKAHPEIRTSGRVIYPRAADQFFDIYFGGTLVDGKYTYVEKEGKRPTRAALEGSADVQVSDAPGTAESAVAINPVFPDIVIAGANGPTGQEMFYSTDGAATWTNVGALPNSCCDPTVGWSSDGTLAYTATLATSPPSTVIEVEFYRSDDFGQTWQFQKEFLGDFLDKEYLHVDRSLVSPYRDNIYLTWHNFNVMQFTRSTDRGQTFDPVVAFNSAPLGIGSDITTDSAGAIYYTYPAFDTRQIILLKSTDGGDTFGAPVVVDSTFASFIFPVPSMDTREVFLYTSADADRSGGTYDGSIYIAWTDSTAFTSGTPANNHARIVVAHSRDGGDTWSTSIPHATNNMDTVDRYHPWLAVGERGVVHVGYYDTIDSGDRLGVDFYYANSDDGGQTWNTPVRVSASTSDSLSDNFEFGDYNGMSVVNGKVIPIWTDNRASSPTSPEIFAGLLSTGEISGPEIWVDFTHTGVESGTQAEPFNTLAEAITAVDSGGVIKLVGAAPDSNSAERPIIAKTIRLEAVSGSVRVGLIGGGGAPLYAPLNELRQRYGFHSAMAKPDLPFTVDGNVDSEAAATHAMAARLDSDDSERARHWAVFQPQESDSVASRASVVRYDAPQRVWLPLPADVPSNTVTLSVARLGEEPEWRAAGAADDVLVAGSEVRIRIEGTTYLGVLVRSAALARLDWEA